MGMPPTHFEGNKDDLIKLGIRKNSKKFRRKNIIDLGIRGDLQMIIESR
jgi:hypothetical protein